MVRTAIVGASGYTGIELLRLVLAHPDLELCCATSRQYEGKPLAHAFPSLRNFTDLTFSPPDPDLVARHAGAVFTALPHKTAMEFVPKLRALGVAVVDLSADFRFRDPGVYASWYSPHTAPDLLPEAVYGLPELYKESIRRTRLVGNPGCYPTSVIIGLASLLKHRRIDPATIIVDSKSGASGAGREPTQATLFCEVSGAFKAYKIGEHRHTPEMEQELAGLAGTPVTISFTPHLVPMSRGILSTMYAKLTDPVDEEALLWDMRSFYEDAPFVRVVGPGEFPNTSSVLGSNFCDVGLRVDRRTGRVVVVSAIDNLVKGAAGQAVQNMNLMLGLEETAGLQAVPLFP